jgi:hypothetical protein
MAAHPNLKQEDADQIVSWVLSLANKAALKKSLPLTGSIVPAPGQKPASTLVLAASYTDKGGNNIKALTGNAVVSLRSNMVTFKGNEKAKGFTPFKFNGKSLLILPADAGWFAIDSIDLTGVRSINVNAMWQAAPAKGLQFEIRADAPDGKLLGKGSMPAPKKDQKGGAAAVPVEATADGKFHTVYFMYTAHEKIQGGVTAVQFNGGK